MDRTLVHTRAYWRAQRVTPAEYLNSVKERLLTDAIVAGFDIRRERHTVTPCHLRVRVSLGGGSPLEFSEYG